ncbi:hypothetical protein CVT24_006593 [Panaeolus cyanescens]|uniref:Uncharacterized protein n=1 Tax=Panaeolus cyanescens TaxID=181874 RepID=A0A409WCE7_9AGAR|nr:hypothetical protein CVT24_006593 [Panaeolus cyanescens]
MRFFSFSAVVVALNLLSFLSMTVAAAPAPSPRHDAVATLKRSFEDSGYTRREILAEYELTGVSTVMDSFSHLLSAHHQGKAQRIAAEKGIPPSSSSSSLDTMPMDNTGTDTTMMDPMSPGASASNV